LFEFRSVNNFASITCCWPWPPSIQTEPRAKQLSFQHILFGLFRWANVNIYAERLNYYFRIN